MKLFLRYLQSKLGVILLFLAFGAVLAFSFVLYRLPAEAVLYPAVLCVLLGIGVLLLDFFRVRRRHMVLRDLKEIDAELPEVRDIEAEDYREIVRLLREANREARTRSETDMAAMVDYYTLWVHQIKTPIAAMRLRLQDEDSELSRALLSDLGRIERYVSMVLTYLRLENGATDYVIKETDLDSVIRPVLRQFAGEFISRKLKLDYTPAERKVLTDGKWLSFVVEQVLSNALKYTPSGSVSISMEDPATLVVRDTGIGIPPEDLPRVFERNYTGLAGRADTRASGIGLSLCKSVCDRLGHTISIESTPGEGTSVRIDLSARKLEIE
ncbi:sensor histidine kinase [Clostridiales bacterium]|nr:sensor histidine kinase [Clostridiales bacterium]